MILAEEKIFFYHVPKTGGSSIERYLFNQFDYRYPNYNTFTGGFISLDSPENPYGWIPISITHIPFSELVELASRSKINIDNSWNIFTIVRNAYNRLSSAIFFQPTLLCYRNSHTLRTHKEKQFLFNKSQSIFFHRDNSPYDWFGHKFGQSDLLDFNPKFDVKIYKYEEGLEKVITTQFKNTLPNPDLKLKRENDHFKDSNFPRTAYDTLWTYDFIKNVNNMYTKDFERFDYQMLDPNDYPKF